MKSLLTIWLAGALCAQELAPVLVQRVDSDRKNIGIVLGVLDENGRHVITHGKSGTDRALDGSTVFEIGSISKTFTGLLLADMIERGEVGHSRCLLCPRTARCYQSQNMGCRHW
jgi:CubicO group peptidase (beta-lactamase class C family)